MTTLRELVRSDTAIAGITGDECHFIAAVLLFAFECEKRWYLRWLLPTELRGRGFQIKMISAVLGRTPKEREPSLNEQIRIAMAEDRKTQ